MKILITTIFTFIIFIGLSAQRNFHIVLISDDLERESDLLGESIKSEIGALFNSSYQLKFTEILVAGDVQIANKQIDEIYSHNTADVIIGTGVITSHILSKRSIYPLPTIAAINLDNRLYNKLGSTSTSSIHNYTFIESPFNIEKDLHTLAEISNSKKICVLVEPALDLIGFDIKGYLSQISGFELELLNIKTDPQSTLDDISLDVNGIYVMSPLAKYSSYQVRSLFERIIKRKLPSLSLLDSPMLEYGAYAAYSSSENLQKIPRRIALNVYKIAEGKDPKNFPVEMETFTDQLIINMESVNKTGVYPTWSILDNSILININKANTERKINLKAAIAEGLQNNLGYLIEKKQTQIAGQDVSLARSNYLPQLDVSSNGAFLDENTVNSSFGTKGSFNWSAGASFTQLILSEPALANISIQKLLFESQKQMERQSELDVILDVALGYFNYLQIQSLTQLQNENISVKNKNLDIAINKERVGYGSESDVYRWETELALAKVDFNEAVAQKKSVQFQLNQILNRSINEEFLIDDFELTEHITKTFDDRFIELIDNPGALEKFADFMVGEAMTNLPELHQIDLAIKAQERLFQSKKSAFYSPTLSFSANYNYPIRVVNPGEPLPIPGVVISSNPTWNAVFLAQFPIFSGASRRHEKQKAQIGLNQLHDQQLDLRNKLELQVRANLEHVNASYNNLKLSRSASEYAQKNVNIVQDLYKEGQVNITALIDAQNAALGAEINAINAVYQFMIDFFAFERSTGNYMSLSTEAQRSDLLARFIQYKLK